MAFPAAPGIQSNSPAVFGEKNNRNFFEYMIFSFQTGIRVFQFQG